ncbi:unnamed protein product, partial [Rotaria magnacalcarata]
MNNANGQIMAGGSGNGNRLDQLNGPIDVIVHKDTGGLIVCDRGNCRILQWSYHIGKIETKILIDNIHCWGLTMDNKKYLYASDTEKDEIKRYQIGDKNGTVVAGDHGQ